MLDFANNMGISRYHGEKNDGDGWSWKFTGWICQLKTPYDHPQVLLIWSWLETHLAPHRTYRYHPDRIFGGNHQLLLLSQKWTNGCEKISHQLLSFNNGNRPGFGPKFRCFPSFFTVKSLSPATKTGWEIQLDWCSIQLFVVNFPAHHVWWTEGSEEPAIQNSNHAGGHGGHWVANACPSSHPLGAQKVHSSQRIYGKSEG